MLSRNKLLSILCSLSCMMCTGSGVASGVGGVDGDRKENNRCSYAQKNNDDFLISYDELLSKHKDQVSKHNTLSASDIFLGRLNDEDAKALESAGVVYSCPDSLGNLPLANMSCVSIASEEGRSAFRLLSALSNSCKDSKRYDYYLKKVDDIIGKCNKLAQENADTYNSQKNLIWLYSVPSLLLLVAGAVFIGLEAKSDLRGIGGLAVPAWLIALILQLNNANDTVAPAEKASCYRGIALFLQKALELAKKNVESSEESDLKDQSKQVESDAELNGRTV